MKKIGLWLKIKRQALIADKRGEKRPAFARLSRTAARQANEMAGQLERMGKLGGQLFVMKMG